MEKFLIPGSPTDYYVAIKKGEGIVEYSALRGKVRHLADIYSKFIYSVISSGGNPHTAALDASDQLKDFLANEPSEAVLAFYEVYTEEMNASALSTEDETRKINEDISSKEKSNANAAQWIVAAIIFLIAMAFIFN